MAAGVWCGLECGGEAVGAVAVTRVQRLKQCKRCGKMVNAEGVHTCAPVLLAEVVTELERI